MASLWFLYITKKIQQQIYCNNTYIANMLLENVSLLLSITVKVLPTDVKYESICKYGTELYHSVNLAYF